MKIDERIERIRRLMEADGLDGWIINGSDPHSSEYAPPRWRTREFATGFTGSAGTVLVTRAEACLWTDSRYHIQAEAETRGTGVRLFKEGLPGTPDFWEFLKASKGSLRRLGSAADCLTKGQAERLEGEGFEVVPTRDYLDEVWEDRPPVPASPVRMMPDSVCGLGAGGKLDAVRARMGDLDYVMVSSLDDIAWTLNLRGADIAYNPVFLSYLLIGKKEAALFADKARFSPEVLAAVEKVVRVLPYGSVVAHLGTLSGGLRVGLDSKRTNMLVYNAFPEGTVIVDQTDITTEMKACKSPVELEGMRAAHVLDGTALVEFLAKVARRPSGWTEMALTGALEAERAGMEGYIGPSFGPIAGYAAHGAMCHYSATPETSSAVGRGLVVLDTGGLYETGMTDVTRTLLFGEPTADERRDYTLVLKGHLALARTRFPEGTCGLQLDALAAQFLWNEGLMYSHGTGHGVGFALCVHEGPASISRRAGSPAAEHPLKEGMVLSDEPGVYLEGRHGVRIENLVAVAKDRTTEFGTFLRFEPLTLCPYERRLIDKSLLTDEEKSQVDAYHRKVLDVLAPRLSPEGLAYLEDAARPL